MLDSEIPLFSTCKTDQAVHLLWALRLNRVSSGLSSTAVQGGNAIIITANQNVPSSIYGVLGARIIFILSYLNLGPAVALQKLQNLSSTLGRSVTKYHQLLWRLASLTAKSPQGT